MWGRGGREGKWGLISALYYDQQNTGAQRQVGEWGGREWGGGGGGLSLHCTVTARKLEHKDSSKDGHGVGVGLGVGVGQGGGGAVSKGEPSSTLLCNWSTKMSVKMATLLCDCQNVEAQISQ